MFVELCITSNFTFLTGGSHAEEYVDRAALTGMRALAVADVNSVAGIVRAHTFSREIAKMAEARARLEAEQGIIGPPKPAHLPEPYRLPIDNAPRLLPAARIVTEEGLAITALPRDRAAWGRLSRLISTGRLRAEKGSCLIRLGDLGGARDGMELLLHPPGAGLRKRVGPLLARYRDDMHLVLAPRYDGRDPARFTHLAALAEELGLPTVASAEPIMHHGRRRKLVDVLSAVREGVRVEALGHLAQPNAERRLRSESEMLRLFAGHEDAVHRSGEIADRLGFQLDELRYEYPSEIADGETPSARLSRLARRGLRERYPAGAPERVSKMLEHELALIAKLNYEPYFLTVNDIVAFARSRGILCQGRGSAANSVVCYALGVTSVSPEIGTMVFERFVSEARDEPPDIDVDFEHERREEVIQHIYDKYGRHRAGLCATVIHYRPRSAIREVGKVMGLSEDVTSALARTIWGSWGSSVDESKTEEAGLNRDDPYLKRVVTLTEQLIGMPRHLSQHVGGFILTQGPLVETVPVGNGAMADRSFIEWDKDDIDELGIMKVDVLALGMLTCIRKAFDLIDAHYGQRYTLASVPREVPEVYDMLCKADSIGVFQIESRAQMSMLPRLKPRTFYDLVIEVAIVRPGPIQGDMVHPYLRRRSGKEKVEFPSPHPDHGPPDELKNILNRTMGVPIFQEQAMKIAIDAARFTSEEANELRKAMATFRSRGTIERLESKMVSRMIERGYDMDFAHNCFNQIKGFGDYGFPESHAASFADLAYVSSWIKHFHPDVFCAALLNSQPMGFYAPAQIVRDAREHGVEVRAPDVNYSDWDNLLEPVAPGRSAVRLGFRQIGGIAKGDAVDGGDHRRVDPLRPFEVPGKPVLPRRQGPGESNG